MTQSIILAAGIGSRLHPHTNDSPKALIKLDSKSIIDYQIEALQKNGVRNIIIVVGYKADKIKKHLGDSFTYVYNEKFATTSNLYSLWCAIPEIKDDFIVSMADSIFHPSIIKTLLNDKHCITTMVDNNKNLDEEAYKARIKGNILNKISRNLGLRESHGEFLALTKFSGAWKKLILKKIDILIRSGHTDKNTSFLLNNLLKDNTVHVKRTNCLPWIEIDTPDDLERARKEVIPSMLKYW